MCNDELTIEDITLCGNKALVRVWPCEQCQQNVAELVASQDV
jgi:cytidine deaminase